MLTFPRRAIEANAQVPLEQIQRLRIATNQRADERRSRRCAWRRLESAVDIVRHGGDCMENAFQAVGIKQAQFSFIERFKRAAACKSDFYEIVREIASKQVSR